MIGKLMKSHLLMIKWLIYLNKSNNKVFKILIYNQHWLFYIILEVNMILVNNILKILSIKIHIIIKC